jgi:hypothetical protein
MSEQESFLRIYADEKCSKPISKIDFGRLVLGETYSWDYYMKNHSPKWIISNIRLNEAFESNEMKVEHPELLLPGEVARVKLTFSPSLSRNEPMFTKGLFSSELWMG